MPRDTIKEVASRLSRPKPKAECLRPEDALSTGSTLLNLEMSGHADAGFFPKRIYRFIGKSGSGKTWLTLNAFAEACRNKRYAKHRLIHDNPEDGAQMDFEYYFGADVARRIEARKPRTVEEFCGAANDLFKKGDPFICILDSVDALTTLDDQAYRKKLYSAIRNRKNLDEISGTMGTAKAKALSAGFNELCANIHESDSIIIVIQHAKVNIGRDAFFKPLTVSGGLSPQYFADVTIWTAVSGTLSKSVGDSKYKTGITVALKIDKNRHTGNENRLVEIPILNKYGMDDITSCIEYLIENKHWTKKDGGIYAPEFGDKPMRRAELIETIESADLEPELKQIVAGKWQEIEDELTPQRKRRY